MPDETLLAAAASPNTCCQPSERVPRTHFFINNNNNDHNKDHNNDDNNDHNDSDYGDDIAAPYGFADSPKTTTRRRCSGSPCGRAQEEYVRAAWRAETVWCVPYVLRDAARAVPLPYPSPSAALFVLPPPAAPFVSPPPFYAGPTAAAATAAVGFNILFLPLKKGEKNIEKNKKKCHV